MDAKKKMTQEDTARALVELFSQGKVFVDDHGLPRPTEQANAEAIESMGGRAVINVAYALRNAIETEGSIASRFEDDVELVDSRSRLFFELLKAVQLVEPYLRRSAIWKRLVTDLETKYLEPDGYFQHSSRAFLPIRWQ